MLTSKPMYKESKCMWGFITWCRSCTVIKPCACMCPFSLTYVAASYGYCCSCCSCSTWVKKENEVAAIQEHKKPTSKRN
jgi:hypothetical protein